jgi:hypothetical protein
VKVTTSASIPTSLASVDIHLTGDDQNGESAICLDVHTSASLSATSCSGTDDPSGPRCFEGTAGALGVTETVKVNLEEVNVGSGKVSFTGSGVEAFTCSHKSYTHTGLDLDLEDLSDCMPSTVSIKELQYCSDSDAIDVSVKVKDVPLAIKTALTRIACDGEDYESCQGSADPVVTEPTCYQGRGGALGLTETVTVILNDFSDSAGHLDFSGDGIIGFSCTGKSLTKSGQEISLEDSSDCLPDGVEVSSVKYCSDSDTIKVTVKDTAVPLPVSALLSKVACSAEEVAVKPPAQGFLATLTV